MSIWKSYVGWFIMRKHKPVAGFLIPYKYEARVVLCVFAAVFFGLVLPACSTHFKRTCFAKVTHNGVLEVPPPPPPPHILN